MEVIVFFLDEEKEGGKCFTSFVNVLVDVFHGSKAYSASDIDVAVEPYHAKRIIGYNPMVVKPKTTNVVHVTIIAVAVLRIPILVHCCTFLERLGVSVHAFAVSHTW